MPDSSAPLNSTSALAGLRVLDLSTVLAGPNCARYLADFGADVIKIERPDGGDSLRNMGWRDPVDGEGLWWRLVNRNKRTIALNLKDDTDRDLFSSMTQMFSSKTFVLAFWKNLALHQKFFMHAMQN
jgi:crotonobetainyl-CoA:carnitine CoA-transferase CaiB-like acyl-CoA transferase